MDKIKDYSMKYRFQWWWYSDGGKELVENTTMTIVGIVGAFAWWCFAYLMDPPGM
jgi:hypothetical protein